MLDTSTAEDKSQEEMSSLKTLFKTLVTGENKLEKLVMAPTHQTLIGQPYVAAMSELVPLSIKYASMASSNSTLSWKQLKLELFVAAAAVGDTVALMNPAGDFVGDIVALMNPAGDFEGDTVAFIIPLGDCVEDTVLFMIPAGDFVRGTVAFIFPGSVVAFWVLLLSNPRHG